MPLVLRPMTADEFTPWMETFVREWGEEIVFLHRIEQGGTSLDIRYLGCDLKDRHVCAYADLTSDTAENRVVLAALRLLPALLRGKEAGSLVRRVRALLPRFAGVTVVSHTQALGLLRGVSFHRLNQTYAPVLGLCRLALQHLTLDAQPGPHPFASFLVDMPRLFESFITERLRFYLAQRGLRVVAQRYDYLDEGRRVGIRHGTVCWYSIG